MKLAGVRNTPAYAGNGLSRRHCGPCIREHPRLRGERGPIGVPVELKTGTPPPTRGTAAATAAGTQRLGNTPAYAGNGVTNTAGCSSRREHPRLRGERDSMSRPKLLDLGTPPPTRGTVLCSVSAWDKSGNTPAYAGNGRQPHAGRNRSREHPRLRGERTS